jgi:hypothetical protein
VTSSPRLDPWTSLLQSSLIRDTEHVRRGDPAFRRFPHAHESLVYETAFSTLRASASGRLPMNHGGMFSARISSRVALATFFAGSLLFSGACNAITGAGDLRLKDMDEEEDDSNTSGGVITGGTQGAGGGGGAGGAGGAGGGMTACTYPRSSSGRLRQGNRRHRQQHVYVARLRRGNDRRSAVEQYFYRELPRLRRLEGHQCAHDPRVG